MSTSSAGTHINFGSQAIPDSETERTPAPPGTAELQQGDGLANGSERNGEGLAVFPAGDESVRQLAATSSVAAEAQQGDGPAAASASGSAVGQSTVESRAVSVVVGPNGAAAACEIGVVVVGPQGAAAASEMGVASAGAHGAAAAGNGANSASVAIDSDGNVHGSAPAAAMSPDAVEERFARLEDVNRELRDLIASLSGHRGRGR
jgi:hypothetical protein